MPFVFYKAGKALISVEDLSSKAIVEPKSAQQKIDFWGGTTNTRGILSCFSDKRPNSSHLRGAPKSKMA